MQKRLVFLFLLLPLFAAAQQSFTVEAHIKDLGNHNVRVVYQQEGKQMTDTLVAQTKDLVVWKGSTAEPQLVRMDVLDSTLLLVIGKAAATPPSLMFLLSNSTIRIQGHAREIYAAEISSEDPEVMAYEKLRLEDIPIVRETWALQGVQNQKMIAKDTAGTGEIKDKIAALRKKNQALRDRFVSENPAAFSSILVLQSLFLIFPPDELEKKFDRLDGKYKDSAAAKSLQTRIQSIVKTSVGKPVIPFSQTGHDGKVVDIAALKGKVILIDFWGSWCVPCRKSHPDLKVLYEKYKSRGFEIVGVANEMAGRKKSKPDQDISWRKAIEEDGIHWLHVLYDPEVTDIIKAYDINMYPTKFLVDQQGNFVMKITGNSPQIHESLEKKLEELIPPAEKH